MKKQYKSSITKNHKLKKISFFRWCSLKRIRSLLSFFFFFFLVFAPEIIKKKKNIVGKSQETNDA